MQQNFVYTKNTEDLKITVQPFYVNDKSDPSKDFYFYAYRVVIHNNGHEPMQLMKRQWVIKDGLGKIENVQGDGVIGKQPIIEPGDFFTYTSFSILRTSTGNMRGRYQFKDVSGHLLWADIPLFFLRRPETFH